MAMDNRAPLSSTNTIAKHLKEIKDNEVNSNCGKIYSGELGTINKGRWSNIYVDVAIKIRNASHKYANRHFENEIKMLDYIASKNPDNSPFTKIYGCNDNMIVMEYMDKGDLIDFVLKYNEESDKKYLPHIALDIFKGMECLQSYNIIHRDIKGDNILISACWEAKICDFGNAVIADENHEYIDGDMVGTIYYLAPELIQDYYKTRHTDYSIRYTFASDMYCASIVIYSLFAQKGYYSSLEKHKEIFDHISDESTRPVKNLSAVPQQFSLFIQKNWQVNPKERMTATEAREMAEKYLGF